MITCPKCGQSLMDWVVQCQFCGSDTKSVVRPVAPVKVRRQRAVASWVWPAYYGVAIYWALGGIINIIIGVFGVSKGGSSYIIDIIGGLATMLVGIGLALKVELARGIANIFAFIKMGLGILGLIGTLFGMAIFGAYAFIFVIANILDIATAAFMMYLLGETD